MSHLEKLTSNYKTNIITNIQLVKIGFVVKKIKIISYIFP